MLDLPYLPFLLLVAAGSFILGAVAATGLIHLGYTARERRTKLDTALTRERIRAAEQAAAWHRACAANDDAPRRTARAELRGGPR